MTTALDDGQLAFFGDDGYLCLEQVVDAPSLTRLREIYDAALDHPSSAVSCPVAGGGATFHTVRTLHHTGPNQTDVRRRAWIVILEVA